jgi:hypothetical protein
MGLYLKKSISLGPLRFNLSKSGGGLSLGVKGLRFGVGPRGTYVHAGAGGLYYRKTLSGSQAVKQEERYEPTFKEAVSFDRLQNVRSYGSDVILEFEESKSNDLIQELNEKSKRIRFSIIPLYFGAILSVMTASIIPLIFFGLIAAILCPIDSIRKTAVIFYDLEDSFLYDYESFITNFSEFLKSQSIWSVDYIAEHGEDSRYYAGADKVLDRKKLFAYLSQPTFLKTNIDEVPMFKIGAREFHFLPDQIIFKNGSVYASVSYDDLELQDYTQRFIEDENVPCDAEIVDYTWRYVNRNGSPDLRFKDNKEIPVVNYQYLEMSSNNGVNELLCISKLGHHRFFIDAINSLSSFHFNFELSKDSSDGDLECEAINEYDIFDSVNIENIDLIMELLDEHTSDCPEEKLVGFLYVLDEVEFLYMTDKYGDKGALDYFDEQFRAIEVLRTSSSLDIEAIDLLYDTYILSQEFTMGLMLLVDLAKSNYGVELSMIDFVRVIKLTQFEEIDS